MDTPDYYDIVLTDIRYHCTKPRKPHTFLRSVLRMFHSGRPSSRAHGTNISRSPEGQFKLSLPIGSLPPAAAGKILRVWVPCGGIPCYWGDDILQNPRARGILGMSPLSPQR
jgi:hypothetical protein